MLAAGLVARNAVARGLTSKPWVKTSLAPGSKVVTKYLDHAGLTDDLEALGFHLVGYGCTTCIGNSGPLPRSVSEAVAENDLAVVSVLSGNRNFEGRINPDVKMNYLASPPLVVAYALAGSMDADIVNDPIGVDRRRRGRLPARPVAVGPGGRRDRRARGALGDVPLLLRRRLRGRRALELAGGADRRPLRLGRALDLRPPAAVLRGDAGRAGGGVGHRGRARARAARRLGHDRPHLPRGLDQARLAGGAVPAGARRLAARLQLATARGAATTR